MTPVGKGSLGDDEHDDADGSTSAADEPTAIWDIDALRAAGLSELLERNDAPEEPRRPTTSPPQNSDPSMVISTELLTDAPADDAEAPAKKSRPDNDDTPSQGIPLDSVRPSAPPEMRPRMDSIPARRYGWGAAVGAGVVFFAAVYALIRFFL